MKIIKENFYVLIVLISWIIFSAPYLFKGVVPFPSTYQVNNFAPWSAYEKFWGPVKNGAMPDVITQIYPWKHLTIELYKKGKLPSWNPYNFSGNPHIANFQTAAFSPFNLLFFLTSFIDAWSIVVLVQPLLAGLCFYVLLREFNIDKAGAIVGSISYMFCGFIVVWMAYGTLAMAVSFLPLALLGIEKYFKKPNVKNYITIVASIVLSFFSGHFQTSLYLLIFSFSFLIFKTVSEKKLKVGILSFTAFLVSIIISSAQLFPSIQLYLHSVRSEIFIQTGGIPFFYLITLAIPDFFGNPVTRNDWFGYYAEWSSFIGVVPLALALYAVFFCRRKLVLFFIFTSFISLLLAIDSPVQAFLGSAKIPVLSTSNPSRIIVLLSFSLSILAGIGLEEFYKSVNLRNKGRYIPLVITWLLLFVVWAFLLIFKNMPAAAMQIASRNSILPTILLFVFSLLYFLPLFSKSKKKYFIFSAIIIALVSFDSVRFAKKWMPFETRSKVFQDVPVIEGIKNNISHNRIFGNLGTEVASYYGIATIEGYDPLYIERYGEFVQSANTGKYTPAQRSVVKLDRRGKYADRVLDVLSVSLVFHPRPDTNQGWAYPVWENENRYSIIYQDDKFQLFKNNHALKRATLFYEYEAIRTEKEMLERFYSDSFDFRKILLLEENIPQLIGNGENVGDAQVISYSADKVTIKAKTTDTALLFLADTYYPGWKAIINGSQAKILRADYAFRAVVIPKGESIIEFTFNPFLF